MSTYTTTFTTTNQITGYTWSVSGVSGINIVRTQTGNNLPSIDRYTFVPEYTGTFVVSVTGKDNGSNILIQNKTVYVSAVDCGLAFDSNTYINIIIDPSPSMSDASITPHIRRVRNYLLKDYFVKFYGSEAVYNSRVKIIDGNLDQFEPSIYWMGIGPDCIPTSQLPANNGTNKIINLVFCNESDNNWADKAGYYLNSSKIEGLPSPCFKIVKPTDQGGVSLIDRCFIYYNTLTTAICNNSQLTRYYKKDFSRLLSDLNVLKNTLSKWKDNFTGIFLQPITTDPTNYLYSYSIDYQNFLNLIINEPELLNKKYKDEVKGELSLYNYKLRSNKKTKRLLHTTMPVKADASFGSTTLTADQYTKYKNFTGTDKFKNARKFDDYYFYSILNSLNAAGYINLPVSLPTGYTEAYTENIDLVIK